jgi:hypothetical protein
MRFLRKDLKDAVSESTRADDTVTTCSAGYGSISLVQNNKMTQAYARIGMMTAPQTEQLCSGPVVRN